MGGRDDVSVDNCGSVNVGRAGVIYIILNTVIPGNIFSFHDLCRNKHLRPMAYSRYYFPELMGVGDKIQRVLVLPQILKAFRAAGNHDDIKRFLKNN